MFRSPLHFFSTSAFSSSRTQTCFPASSQQAFSFPWGNGTVGSGSPGLQLLPAQQVNSPWAGFLGNSGHREGRQPPARVLTPPSCSGKDFSQDPSPAVGCDQAAESTFLAFHFTPPAYFSEDVVGWTCIHWWLGCDFTVSLRIYFEHRSLDI